jgi:hypothetical protein
MKMKYPKTCPAQGGPCPHVHVCLRRRLCACMHVAPIDIIMDHVVPAVHFVGFRGDEYNSAVRVFGLPDFFHKVWDQRAAQDVAPADTVVFAKYHYQKPTQFCYDDSNQPCDPAFLERLECS